MTKNILLSLICCCALVAAFALPVNAAQHNQHHEGNKHHSLGHLEHGHSAHSIKTELEAKEKAVKANKVSHQHNVYYRVNASRLNERVAPGVKSHKVGSLKEGTLVEVKELSHDGKWALCHTGTWVSTKYLEKNSEKHHSVNHLGEKHGTHVAHGNQTSHQGTHNTHGVTNHGMNNAYGNYAMHSTHGNQSSHYGTHAYGTNMTHGNQSSHSGMYNYGY